MPLTCTSEFFIEKPSSLARQSATWSSYKNHNIFQVLIGISPDGTMVFISNLYEGLVSDVDLVSQSGLLALLERDDSIMADKGLDIQHLLGTWYTFEHSTLSPWEPANDS